MTKLLIICGPTATGKTKLALRLAHEFKGELISADSRQVYKNLNILTGKDLPKQFKIQNSNLKIKYKNTWYQLKAYIVNGIKLWMYDVVDFNEEFSVAHFQVLAKQVIEDIWKRGKLAIIVGGTGLYLRAVTQDLLTIHVPPNQSLRQKLAKMSLEQLQKKLQLLNFDRWQNMNDSDRANPRRLVRAIEIAQWLKHHQVSLPTTKPLMETLWIGLGAPKVVLKQRIEERVRRRWVNGAISEVQKLKDAGVKLTTVSTILGFDPLRHYLNGELAQSGVLSRWVTSEFDYAKRQLTWFKKQPEIHWFDISRPGYQMAVMSLVKTWYTRLQ